MNQGIDNIAEIFERRLKSGKIDVPMLPETASKVVTLSQDPDSDAAELAQLIQSDQSLAGHVMRIANSAAYSPNTSLVSLQQAVTRLGINLISDIALAASISSKMFSAPGYEQYLQDIWRHALATALWSKEVARAARRNVEASFLCGLLHSIGRPVALQECLEIAQKESIPLSEEDVITLVKRFEQGTGLAVVERWEMPKVVCEVIRNIDNRDNSGSVVEQAASVHCGAQFASHILNPDDFTRQDLCEHPVLADINLYNDEVELLLEKSDAIKSTMESMLS